MEGTLLVSALLPDDRRAAQLRVAIGLLQWTVMDLFIAALSIGSHSSQLDLIKYLGTGSPDEARFFAAIAVNEELREQGIPFRVDEDYWQPRPGMREPGAL